MNCPMHCFYNQGSRIYQRPIKIEYDISIFHFLIIPQIAKFLHYMPFVDDFGKGNKFYVYRTIKGLKYITTIRVIHFVSQ